MNETEIASPHLLCKGKKTERKDSDGQHGCTEFICELPDRSEEMNLELKSEEVSKARDWAVSTENPLAERPQGRLALGLRT